MKELNYFKNKPKASVIDVSAYLNRLKLKNEEPSLAYLKKLHSAHIHLVPFENLDIHYQRPITLDYQKIFKKIVLSKRGGFCYELNGLFYHLLYHLGFDCYIVSGQMLKNTGEYDHDFGHMMVITTIDGVDFLVDVGFGNSFLYPKEMVFGKVQMDYTTYWKFETDPDENYLLKYSSDASTYYTKYKFVKDKKQIIQFLNMCEYHQKSAESRFTQGKLITIKTAEGRITLTNKKIKILNKGETTEDSILNEDEFLSKLEQYFKISYRQLRPLKQ